jgi:hypothetical protein
MEPPRNPNDRANRPSTYTPHRSRWPGLLGAAAIVAAVVGVALWMRDDAPKEPPPDASASVTVPARP